MKTLSILFSNKWTMVIIGVYLSFIFPFGIFVCYALGKYSEISETFNFAFSLFIKFLPVFILSFLLIILSGKRVNKPEIKV